VKVLAVQAGFVPDAIQGGLSPEVTAAIPELCRLARSKLAPG
jgi:hypothetical protein